MICITPVGSGSPARLLRAGHFDRVPHLPRDQSFPGAAGVGRGFCRHVLPGSPDAVAQDRSQPIGAGGDAHDCGSDVAPAVMLVSVIAREAPQLYDYAQQVSLTAPDRIARIWEVVRCRSPTPLPEDPTFLLREGLQRVLGFLAPRAGAAVADLFATLGSLFVMLFAMFFLLRDGHTLARQVRDLLPVPEGVRDRLMIDTRDLIIASVGAGLLVAAIQGAIGGLAFWLLGIDAPVIWGVVMALCSLIPVVGAALVWVPAALWLLLSNDVARGVILVIVGSSASAWPTTFSGRYSLPGAPRPAASWCSSASSAAPRRSVSSASSSVRSSWSPPGACCGCSREGAR